jgi:hypothetical protein
VLNAREDSEVKNNEAPRQKDQPASLKPADLNRRRRILPSRKTFADEEPERAKRTWGFRSQEQRSATAKRPAGRSNRMASTSGAEFLPLRKTLEA